MRYGLVYHGELWAAGVARTWRCNTSNKWFPSIETAIDEEGALLIMPPFKRNNLQFNTDDNEEGYKISSLRIHVERAIQRLNHFDILKFFK